MDHNHMHRPQPSAADQNRNHNNGDNNASLSLADPLLPPPPSYAPPSYQAQPSSSLSQGHDPPADLPPILPTSIDQSHDAAAPDKLPSLASLTGPAAASPNLGATSTAWPSAPSSSSASPAPVNLSAATTTKLPERPLPKPIPSVTPWPSMNPFTTYYTPGHAQRSAEPSSARLDADSTSNSNNAASPDRLTDGRSVSVSLDDPEVRLAAEALGDLRADFVNSPPSRHTSLPRGSRSLRATQSPQQEPLFSLLTTSHPFLATTIEGATSAYNSSKNFSPRFKTSVEYVEGYLTPIANTVGSVGRVTGVEGGVRWFLGAGRRHHSDLEAEGGSNKRRRVDRGGDEMVGVVVDSMPTMPPPVAGTESPRDSYILTPDRRLSRASTVDTLPAYDEARSPAYTEQDKQSPDRPGSSSSDARRSRLVVSTSGLAVAMSNESLRSLKYCLRWLRRANDHIGGVVTNLKTTLEQYERASSPREDSEAGNNGGDSMEVDGRPAEQRSQEDQTILAARITALKADILKNLQAAIETVSKYAGGALPENARALVHRQLTSLPQRFRYASMVEQQQQHGPDGNPRPSEELTREGANRVLVLAKEGLDMITQVSGVIDGTIVSAEEWCDKLGSGASGEDGPTLPSTEAQALDMKPRVEEP